MIFSDIIEPAYARSTMLYAIVMWSLTLSIFISIDEYYLSCQKIELMLLSFWLGSSVWLFGLRR